MEGRDPAGRMPALPHGMIFADRLGVNRRRAVGAEVVAGGVHFRVWAPAREQVAVVIDGSDIPLEREKRGYFSGLVDKAGAGTLYRFRLDGGKDTYPDPASRFQPDGPFGPSEVIDPAPYRWRDRQWRGIDGHGRVIYEMHVGTFTAEGTYAAAKRHFRDLAGVGVNVIELMPVSEFPGEFGWGYDGVDIWAPTRLYGRPDDLRAFVDEAHAHGLAVILDVVYNHIGPSGCFLREFTPAYFTDRYDNEWGEAMNFDGDDAHAVREFFAENAACWIDEYHFDGLRMDATQSMHDKSGRHIIAEIAECARAAAGERGILLVAENEPQNRTLVDGYGIDAMWNDDWHHSAVVALTGRNEAYYGDYAGKPQELVSMATLGFLFQGQYYRWQKKRRGTSSRDIPARKLVCYLQNHDQIANTARGDRMHRLAAAGALRAMTALLLLQPQTPMLFQGQEFAASAPFVYFADHEPELAELVEKGRREFLTQFESVATPEVQKNLPAPHDRATFEMAKLDHAERETNAEVVALHRDLLRLRRELPFADQRADQLRGSILGDDCFVLRWFAGGADDRLLIVNLGRDLILSRAPDPLLAPPSGFSGWTLLWSSESPSYGGAGMAEPETEGQWTIAGHAAAVLRP